MFILFFTSRFPRGCFTIRFFLFHLLRTISFVGWFLKILCPSMGLLLSNCFDPDCLSLPSLFYTDVLGRQEEGRDLRPFGRTGDFRGCHPWTPEHSTGEGAYQRGWSEPHQSYYAPYVRGFPDLLALDRSCPILVDRIRTRPTRARARWHTSKHDDPMDVAFP